MTPNQDHAELLELAEAFCLDALTDEQKIRLEQLTTSNSDLRRAYVQYVHMHVCLRRAFEHSSEAEGPQREVAFQPAAQARAAQLSFRRTWLNRRVLGLAAAVLFLVGLGAAAFWLNNKPSGPVNGEWVATLTESVACTWDAAEPPGKGSKLRAGRLDLSAGMAEITFASGAVVLLEAPASLDLSGPSRGVLHSGRLVARVPTQAVGFVIETPGANLVDLGTEFGVGVGNSGETLVQVFDGVVVADLNKDGASQQQLKAGQTVQIDGPGSQPRDLPTVAQRFVRRFPPAKARGNEWLTPYNRQLFDTMHIVPAPGPVTVDGKLSDWDRSGMFLCPAEDPYSHDYFVEGAMMYDRDNVYIAAHVRDPAPMCSVIDPATDPGAGWKGGSVQVRLSTDKSLGWPIDAEWHGALRGRRGPLPQDASPNLAHLTMWYFAPEKQPCLHIAYGMALRKEVTNPAGFRGAFRKDADGLGYTMEYAVPWRLLNAEADPPRGGDTLGVCWNVHWSDEEGRVWRGMVVDVLNPGEKGTTFQRASTWGRAVYHKTGRLPAGTVVPR